MGDAGEEENQGEEDAGGDADGGTDDFEIVGWFHIRARTIVDRIGQ